MSKKTYSSVQRGVFCSYSIYSWRAAWYSSKIVWCSHPSTMSKSNSGVKDCSFRTQHIFSPKCSHGNLEAWDQMSCSSCPEPKITLPGSWGGHCQKLYLTSLMTLPCMPQSGCSSLQALCGVSGITCHLHRMMLSLFRSEALVPAEPHGLLRSRDLIHLGPKSPPQKNSTKREERRPSRPGFVDSALCSWTAVWHAHPRSQNVSWEEGDIYQIWSSAHPEGVNFTSDYGL